MTSVVPPICLVCSRYYRDAVGWKMTCEAFPKGEGIPEDIKLSRVDHRQPVAGDNDLQFLPKDDAAAAYAAVIFDPEGA